MMRRCWRRPDRFYWLTSYLAAQGLQRATCRTIAAGIAGLGILPLLMIASPAGPATGHEQLAAVGVSACCLAMSAWWIRGRWPTRVHSAMFVMAAAVCISVATLINANPIAGLLGSVAFAVLGGYIAFFHAGPVMATNLAFATATAAVLALRLAESDVVWAVCAFTFVVLINITVLFTCHAFAHLVRVDTRDTDIEPLTGLLDREAFYRATGVLIASRGREDDRYLVIVVVNLDNFTLLTSTNGEDAGVRARVAVAQTLRETTRHDAVVGHVGDTEYLIADTFTTTDTSPLVERVRSAISTTPPRLTASIGVVSTPLRELADCPPQDLLDELTTIATEAMYRSRRSGGNQTTHVTCPALAVLEDARRPHLFDSDDLI